jgi:hypothetical protein
MDEPLRSRLQAATGPGGLTSPDTGHRAREQPTVATRPLSPDPEDHAQAAAEARGQATMPRLTW